jgi:hypothetical protein
MSMTNRKTYWGGQAYRELSPAAKSAVIALATSVAVIILAYLLPAMVYAVTGDIATLR